MSEIIKKTIFGIAIFIQLIGLNSCIYYEEVTVNDIKNIELLELTGKDITISSEVEIKNPNNYNISVTDSEFNISIEEQLLGTFKIDNEVKINRSSTEYHQLVFKMNMDDFSHEAQSTLLGLVLSGKDRINVKVEGYIKAKAFLLQRKFPVSFEDKVDLEI